MLTPRFHRVRGSSWPVSTEPKKSKRARSNALAQIGRGGRDIAGDQPRPPRADRHLRHHRGERLEEGRLRQDHGRRSIDALRFRPGRPVEAGHLDRQLAQRESCVGRAVLRLSVSVHMDARQRRLERQHRPRIVGRRRRARRARRCASRYCRYWARTPRQRGVVLQVVVAIGKERAALRDAGHRRAGIERVDADGSAERSARGDRREVAGFRREIPRRSGWRRSAAAAG